MVPRTTVAGVVLAVAVALAAPVGATATSAAGPDRPAVLERQVVGHSVLDRRIFAWHVGDPEATTSVVIMAGMHGTELAGQTIARTLRDGNPISGVDLWLVPTYNPDGAVRDIRQNARGVDLNRNYPRKWKPLTGYYYSGPRPASEPETRGFQRFLDQVDPDFVISFHQPLHGIDVRGAKKPAWTRHLAADLHLPTRHVDCGGACHGTMTQWFNHRHDGFAITVELGLSPSHRYLTKVAPRGLLRSIGGRRHAAG